MLKNRKWPKSQCIPNGQRKSNVNDDLNDVNHLKKLNCDDGIHVRKGHIQQATKS
jgi:hypothetical protein